MSSSNCCFLTCIQISQEAGQVVWYSHVFQNFPQFIVIHTVKGFGIVNKAEIDVFLELCLPLVLKWPVQCVLVVQSCPNLCDSKDCSLSGSSVYGILKARILEWVAIPFSSGSFWFMSNRSFWSGLTRSFWPGLLYCRHICYCLSHQETNSVSLMCLNLRVLVSSLFKRKN